MRKDVVAKSRAPQHPPLMLAQASIRFVSKVLDPHFRGDERRLASPPSWSACPGTSLTGAQVGLARLPQSQIQSRKSGIPDLRGQAR
jgi:hypothetical protein